MSGIAGWSDYHRRLTNESDAIKAMAKILAHGRPDSEGFWMSGHTLLCYSGPPMDGEEDAQPIICKKGDAIYVTVFSGELFNTAELIRELEARGHSFMRRTGAHAITHAYMEWGEDCLQRLNGVFALAVRDVERDSLFLARDRLGVKPMFYSEADGSFIFASELKALLAHPGIRPVLGREGLAEIFAIGPARTPGHGIFKGVNELKPGHFVTIGPDKCEIKPYWTLQSFRHEEDLGETVSSVRELVYDAVRRQLPRGTRGKYLLSGGLDSSLICAIAAREAGGKLGTMSLDYRDNDINFRSSAFQPNTDAPWIRRVSSYLGTEHETCIIDTPELLDAIFAATAARDLPGMADIDSSLLLFSRWIGERADVGLSGECADEMFGGYPWFYKPGRSDTFPWAQRLPERLKFYSKELQSLIRPEEYVAERYQETMREVPRFEGDTPEEARARELSYLTITRWLPTLLDRQDRMSAAAGLTLRAPFADYRIAEYMWNVPWRMKYTQNREKGLLRHAMTGVLPDDVLWRKKSPFPKTHNPNYITALRELISRTLDDPASPLRPFIDVQSVRTLADTMTRDTDIPWFGQLMNAPQMLAYLLQIEYWLKEYKVSVV